MLKFKTKTLCPQCKSINKITHQYDPKSDWSWVMHLYRVSRWGNKKNINNLTEIIHLFEGLVYDDKTTPSDMLYYAWREIKQNPLFAEAIRDGVVDYNDGQLLWGNSCFINDESLDLKDKLMDVDSSMQINAKWECPDCGYVHHYWNVWFEIK